MPGGESSEGGKETAKVQEKRTETAPTEENRAAGRPARTRFLPSSVAIGLGALACFLALLPAPQKGAGISSSRYAVNTTELRASKRLWNLQQPDHGDAVYVAANQLAASFVQSAPDNALWQFLNQSAETGAIWAHFQHYMFWSLQRFLGWSRTDASAVLQRQLFVASEEQMKSLWQDVQGLGDEPQGAPTLLDIGSGIGTETTKLAAALGIESSSVTCLESSFFMRQKLSASGFRAASSVEEIKTARFRAVSLLNVLDRCDAPLSLLSAAMDLLEPDGLLVVATPLPFEARVYEGRLGSTWGKAASRPPQSPLTVPRAARSRKRAASFEFGAAAFLAALLPPGSGVELQGWTRAPYVSSGDLKKTHYTMDMALFAFRVPEGAKLIAAADDEGAWAEEHEDDEGEGEGEDAVEAERDEVRALPAQCRGRVVDSIFRWLGETLAREGVEGWGEVLDAGGGFGSMCWLLQQELSGLTEVTASASGTYGGDDLQAAAASVGARVEVVQGNWREEGFLEGRAFEVVVADYLLGAVEYYWPFGAGRMLERLLEAVLPGGYLLVVGMEPYELVLDAGSSGQDRVVLDVEALGDAAAALAGSTTYREMPEDWVLHQLRRRPEFRVVASQQFAMKLSPKSLRKQLQFARKNARAIADEGLRQAFLRRAAALEQEVRGFGTHSRARNYAIVAQRLDAPPK